MDTNDELDNSIIIKRRHLHNNEFIFKNGCLLQNVEKMFDYIEANSQLKIDKSKLITSKFNIFLIFF